MPKRVKKDELQRAIESKERIIGRAKKSIAVIQADANARIAVIQKKIAREEILLDALKRGALKP